jgi:hypothetical protein
MFSMGKHRRFRTLALPFVLLALICSLGCSRPAGFRSTAQSDTRELPFHQDSSGDSGATTSPNGGSGSRSKSQPADPALPFDASAQTLPAGTLLTVRLENTLSSAKLDSGRTFAAVVDEPVLIGGVAVLPTGTSVQGRVESAHSSAVRDTSYVRLALDSIVIGGKDIPLHTSSLFARASAREAAELSDAPVGDTADLARAGTIRLKKGRRLTFRLTSPLAVHSPGTVSRAEIPLLPGTK